MSATASIGASTSSATGGGGKHAKRPSTALAHGAGPTSGDPLSVSASSAGLLVAQTPLTREALAEVAVPENIRFREMELRDAAAVFHLGETVFHSDFFPQLYRTWDEYEVLEMLATSEELCLVAEEVAPNQGETAEASEASEAPSKIVGFVFGSITEKRKHDQSCGMLGWVGVAPSHHRRNIGTVLVHKLFDVFLEEGIKLIIADTPMENVPAIRFLQRMGFGQPVAHVYMSLNLAKKQHHGHHHHNHHHHHHQHHHHHHHGHHHGHGAGSSASSSSSAAASTAAAPTGPPPLPAEAKNVKLRHMTIDDLSAVHDLGERIYDPQLYPNLYRIWSEAEVLELFASDSDFCQVAEYEGKVVGFVMGTTIAKRRSSWRYGYLIWLGVAPEVQRFGVGKRLFQAFKELIEEDGCRILLIDTQESNLPARKFFERAGFGSTESHVYFSKALGPEDAIASEERVLRQSSLPSDQPASASTKKKGGGGFKVSRLFRFKRAHSVLAKAEAEASASAASSAAASVAGDEAAGESGAESEEKDVVAQGPGKGAKRGKGKAAAIPAKKAAAASSSAKRPRRAASGRKK